MAMSIIFLSFVVATGIGGIVTLGQRPLSRAAAYSPAGSPAAMACRCGCGRLRDRGSHHRRGRRRIAGDSTQWLAAGVGNLGAGVCLRSADLRDPRHRNQANGWTLSRPKVGSLSFEAEDKFGIVLLVVLIIVVILVRNFELSQTGRSILATRGSRWGAVSSGVSVVRARLIIFALSATIASLGGLLLGQTLTQVSATSNPPLSALLWVTIVITIGIRRPLGALIAGMSSSVFPQLLSYITTSTQWPSLLFASVRSAWRRILVASSTCTVVNITGFGPNVGCARAPQRGAERDARCGDGDSRRAARGCCGRLLRNQSACGP